MQSSIGTSFSDDDISKYLQDTLDAGQVIPGYGHAVLRSPDPRFLSLMHFAKSRPEIGETPLFQLAMKTSAIATKVLKKHGKVKTPVLFPLDEVIFFFFHR